MRPRPRTLLALLFGVIPVLGTASASAQVVAEHVGLTDPVTEGFVSDTQGTTSVGPVANDLGLDAWRVAATGMARYQTGDLSPSQKADALANGWKITARLRVAEAPDGRGLVTCNLENLGGRRFDINVGLNGSGETFVRLNESIVTNPQLVGVGPTYTLTGSTDDYHLYELVYDAGSQTAALFVDGIERLSDYAGHTNFVRPLGFYMGTYQDHAGHYATARFEILGPMPAPLLPAAALWALGAGFVLVGVRRLRRS